jgi:DNA-binding XRE family transcriptional regulator
MRVVPRARGADPCVELAPAELAALKAARESRCRASVIARHIGVPRLTLVGWEDGKHRPRLNHFNAWCKALEIDPDEILVMSKHKKTDGHFQNGHWIANPIVPITEQVSAVEHVMRMQREFYPRWVAAGKMRQADANKQLCAMAEVLVTLEVYRMGRGS